MKILNEDKIEIDTLDFGEVDIGTTKVIPLYIENATSALLKDISIEIDDSTVKLVELPKEVQPNTIEPFKVSWTPKLKRGLKTKIRGSAYEIYGQCN